MWCEDWWGMCGVRMELGYVWCEDWRGTCGVRIGGGMCGVRIGGVRVV